MIAEERQACGVPTFAEQHHADGYFNKPISASAMNKLVQALTVY